MNSLSIYDLRISRDFEYLKKDVSNLNGRDQDNRRINFLHVCVNQKGEPLITKGAGLYYIISECNLNMHVDFRTLLEKNLILLSTGVEMLAFSGFEKYGKIKKNFWNSSVYLEFNFHTKNIPVSSFKIMDCKTSESIKKTLMDIAWWFDRIPNECNRQYTLIPKNLPSSQIQQFAQPIFTNPTTSTPTPTLTPTQNKILPYIPAKSSSNVTSPSANPPSKPSNNTNSSSTITNTPKPANNITSSPTISNTSTSSFTSLDDFQGNNIEKDTKIETSVLLKQALMLARKEGYTNFSIKNSFDENEPVQIKPYTHRFTGNTCHEAKVNFYITASNTSGKSIKLNLQRELFAFLPVEKDALEAINRACESVKNAAAT